MGEKLNKIRDAAAETYGKVVVAAANASAAATKVKQEQQGDPNVGVGFNPDLMNDLPEIMRKFEQ